MLAASYHVIHGAIARDWHATILLVLLKLKLVQMLGSRVKCGQGA